MRSRPRALRSARTPAAGYAVRSVLGKKNAACRRIPAHRNATIRATLDASPASSSRRFPASASRLPPNGRTPPGSFPPGNTGRIIASIRASRCRGNRHARLMLMVRPARARPLPSPRIRPLAAPRPAPPFATPRWAHRSPSGFRHSLSSRPSLRLAAARQSPRHPHPACRPIAERLRARSRTAPRRQSPRPARARASRPFRPCSFRPCRSRPGRTASSLRKRAVLRHPCVPGVNQPARYC